MQLVKSLSAFRKVRIFMIKTYLPGGPYKSFQVFTRREVTLFNLTQLRKKTKDKRERMPNAATFEKEKNNSSDKFKFGNRRRPEGNSRKSSSPDGVR